MFIIDDSIGLVKKFSLTVNYEDYFQGRVSDSTKFEKFYTLSITVVQEK